MSQTLVLDEFLPVYDHAVSASQVFRAPSHEVLEAAVSIDLYRLPLARFLLAARGLPARASEVVGRRRGEEPVTEPPTFRIRDLPAHGWFVLGERPGVEVVYGTVTQPWRALGGEPTEPVSAERFADFSEPGFAKLAASTSVTSYGTQACILTLETRVAATDAESRRRFRRYWRASGPFIKLIRPSVLRALDRQFSPPSRPGPLSR